MSDFPAVGPTPLFISSVSRYAAGFDAIKSFGATGTLATVSFQTANRAMYVPFVLPWPYPVRRVFWGNGSTVGGNKDFGIYTNPGGERIYSTGQTAESGTSGLQYVTPTPFLLPAGRYYMALVCDAISNHAWGQALAASAMTLAGLLGQASAMPLPSPATFAAQGFSNIFLFGITRTASGF